jgi:hypothetical protein
MGSTADALWADHGVTLVLPCLNEALAVASCVEQAQTALLEADLPGEVIVVDNGSSDGSAEIARSAGARVIEEHRQGYGRALRTGFEHAQTAVVVMADADGTYDLSRLAELAAPVLAGEADMVLATRLEGTTSETMPFLHRYLGTPMITFLTSRACGRRVTSDSQTGYRAFRRDRIAELGLAGDGMELASEMLIKASRAGLRISETSIPYGARIGDSKLDTWSDGWRHLMLILMLAPDLLLIGPGVVVSIVGLAALVLGFVQPEGLEVGSLRWQPVFFAGIALVMGAQAVIAGLVLATFSPVSPVGSERYPVAERLLVPRRAFGLGVGLIAFGVLVDLGLFVIWLTDIGSVPTTGVGFGFAALAQSSLMLGGTVAMFGIVLRFVRVGVRVHAAGPTTRLNASR